ncbi:unnamed protein product [Rangifer tarandus platyrhynchus]|uniref:Uncharacterized protein n=2 Tax=Rangifer tarandus platyrhynchus TaxID=3082113 RepID=A0AC59Y538_RANTA|nr:unnamed protein product [Rangifer tarandus platyrhynchus]
MCAHASVAWYVERTWHGPLGQARTWYEAGPCSSASLPAARPGCYKALVATLFLASAGACTGLFLSLLLPAPTQDWLIPLPCPRLTELWKGSGTKVGSPSSPGPPRLTGCKLGRWLGKNRLQTEGLLPRFCGPSPYLVPEKVMDERVGLAC